MVEAALVEHLGQQGAGVRFDWGPTAAGLLARGDGALVVVDVLSFTTSVSVATGRGIAVVPYPLAGEGAAELAGRLDASLAARRAELSPDHPWSLSPRSLMDAPYTPRLVLPSPNGSAIAAIAASAASAASAATDVADVSAAPTAVLAGCLRNVSATVAWLCARGYGTDERPVWLIGSGERWPDGTLRPAIEDALGAGAIARALDGSGCRLSPEASAAARTFATTEDLEEVVAHCASGRELAAMGFPDEPGVAAALDTDHHASVMTDGSFVRA